MTISRVSTHSLTLAIAVFALGYANPSFAAPPVCPGHPSCKNDSGDGDFDTVFLVAMQLGDELPSDPIPLGLLISDGACGTTVDEPGHQELDVGFPALIEGGCVTVAVCFITDPTGCPLTLRAIGLDMRVNKSDMLIFFTDGEIDSSGHITGGVYVSERLPVTINRSNDGSGSITVEVGLSGLNVEKNHQPDKGDLVGPIAIGNIVYTLVD